MDDSSEDDRPIGARDIVKAATRLLEDDDSGVSGSPVPEWISQHTPVEKGKPEPASSSDSDGIVDLISQDPKDARQNDTKRISGAPADTAKRKTSPPADAIKPKTLKGTSVHHAQSNRLELANTWAPFYSKIQPVVKMHKPGM